MTRSLLYEGRGRQSNWPLILIGVNLTFTGICLFAWSAISLLLADALSWATWSHLGRSMPEFYSYPFLLVWSLPLGGSCAAWLCIKAGIDRVAFTCAFLPISLCQPKVEMSPTWPK